MTRRRRNNLATIIDGLGELKAEIAELEKKEVELSDILRAQGTGAYEGELFRATVSEPGQRQVVDLVAVKEKLGERWVNEHSRWVPIKPTVRVAARTGEEVAA